MRITLAGYNLDFDTIDLLRQLIDVHAQGGDTSHLLDLLVNEPLTPETISAAYARISRSEKKVHELRKDARSSVNRARQSNERIVFGLGHSSISEHATFNLDVTDASRLALEELESHRLASYTESSQRYISMSGDFVIPEEIVAVGLQHEFEELNSFLFNGYRSLSEKLEAWHQNLPERDRQGRAREDARYLLPLSCRGQVGVTINARNAEWIIQQSTHSSLAEVKEMGSQMAKLLRALTPSLIKYTEPLPGWHESNEAIKSIFTDSGPKQPEAEVTLINHSAIAESMVTAALGLRYSNHPFATVFDRTSGMSEAERTALFRSAHSYLTPHSPVRRELELASFTFAVNLSASAFAQLKRHRIATIITQGYDPSLGITIPPAVIEAGLETDFRTNTDKAEEVFQLLSRSLDYSSKPAAQYALTNAHRRRVIFHANAREMVHFSRLREDAHAQWDIRQLAGKMIALAKEAAPGLMFLAAGKDEFESMHATLTGDS